MKKTISILLALVLALTLLSACGGGTTTAATGRQTASAHLDPEGNLFTVTVDLTGGWSVEFATGAVYLYDGEITEGKASIAMGVSLDKEVYDEDLAAAMADEGHKETEQGVMFTYLDSETALLCDVGEGSYFLITTADTQNAEAIFARFDLQAGYGD